MEGGLYFFNSVGLYMRQWVEHFSPKREDFSWDLVYIFLCSLPQEYWNLETLAEIGNNLEKLICLSEQTKQGRHTSFARICDYMNISRSLPKSIGLKSEDID